METGLLSYWIIAVWEKYVIGHSVKRHEKWFRMDQLILDSNLKPSVISIVLRAWCPLVTILLDLTSFVIVKCISIFVTLRKGNLFPNWQIVQLSSRCCENKVSIFNALCLHTVPIRMHGACTHGAFIYELCTHVW